MDSELITLDVTVKGEIVTSNFAAFQAQMTRELECINQDLKTDADFGQAELDVKWIKTTEQTIKEAKVAALQQMDSVNALFSALDSSGEEARQARLDLERKIKTKKAEVKKSILDSAYDSIIATDKGVEHRAGLEKAIKSKRNLESIQKAADHYVQELNDSVSACREVINAHIEEHGKQLIPDVATLELGDAKYLTTELALRVERAKAEEERKRREQEEADRKAAEKVKAEAAERAREEEEALELKRLREKREAEMSDKLDALDRDDVEAKRVVNSEQRDSMPDPSIAALSVAFGSDPEKTARSYFDTHEQKEETKDADVTPGEEMLKFISVVEEAFAPVKEARKKLKHPENIEAAGEFAKSLGAAWIQFKEVVA